MIGSGKMYKSNKIITPIITFVITAIIISISHISCFIRQPDSELNNTTPSTEYPQINQAIEQPETPPIQMLFVMKGVAIDILQKDFSKMKDAGIDILTTEWGMEVRTEKVESFLDKAHNAGLKVVLDGGFSYQAWGFSNDDFTSLPPDKNPIWQRDKVQQWVTRFKNHPAVYGWDICNEYGENLPSGVFNNNSSWPANKITISQLRQARADVLEIDPDKPVLIRMNHQAFEKQFGYIKDNFDKNLADIVMLNLYSNYLSDGRVQWQTVIKDIAQEDIDSLKAIDPDIKIWISVAAFEEKGLFEKPSSRNLLNDIDEVFKLDAVDALGFFEWGPSMDYKSGKIWHLPVSGNDLWKVMIYSIQDYKETNRFR